MRANFATSGRARFPASQRPSSAANPSWWHEHLAPLRSIQEVAQMLGMNPKTVASHESTAIRKLRKAMLLIETHAPNGYSFGRRN